MSFANVASAYPWPKDRPFPTVALQTYDGGGREIIVNVLRRYPAPIVLEVGAFLGGSALQWLEAGPEVSVVCLDPWEGDWWVPHAQEHGWEELQRRFAELRGPLKCFQTNLWDYRKRVVAVCGYAPAKLYELRELGLRPDVIYFDSDKTGSGMSEAATLFPDALIAGDDWTWGRRNGYPIRKSVNALARQTGRHVVVRRATWLLQTDPLTFRQRLEGGISGVKDVLRPIREKLKG